MEKEDLMFVSSIDLLSRTGLSRATLNNYIKSEILPNPLVKRPSDTEHSRAKRMGYFPISALSTLNLVRQYKQQGLSIDEIQKKLTQKSRDSSRSSQTRGIITTHPGILTPDQVSNGKEFVSLEDTRLGSVPLDIPAQRAGGGVSEKDKAIHDLFQHRNPIPLSFSVLATDLHDSMRICAELPPEKYCRLINQMWIYTDGIFKKYFGTYGKQAGNGMVYYFLKQSHSNCYLMNAILCALELKETMKELSEEWKKHIGWHNDLYLNVGINEGYEFFGRIPAAPPLDFIILGDTTHHAVRLSDFSCSGSIWATKNLLNRLDEQDRLKVRYGIHHSQPERETFIENIFSRIVDLIPNDRDNYSMFNDISSMTVTEIQSLQ
jgi:class 3 adenylate cyclase